MRSRPLVSLTLWMGLVALSPCFTRADVDWSSLPITSHGQVQGVTGTGDPTFSTGNFPIRVRGIVLNNPSDMLDSTANFLPWNDGANIFRFGGEWQIYVQSVDPADHAGTAVYMGQNYGNLPFIADSFASYSNSAWNDEVQRVSLGGTLHAGDLVEIRGRAGLPFGGKFNINEAHSTLPAQDFDVVLLQAGLGLPTPEIITLSDVIGANNVALFDSTRATGAEHYQARLVDLRNVSIVDPSSWGANQELTVTDESGRTLTLKLGLNPLFDQLAAPTGPINIVGIFDQESFDNVSGYRLWVMDPAGITATVPEAGSLLLSLAGAAALAGTLRTRSVREAIKVEASTL